ncbi:hypothetical protein D3C76_1233470 [compost metagenome]
MAVGALLEVRQLRLLRCKDQVEAPGGGQAHPVDAVGFVGRHHHQRVLEHALTLQVVEKRP